MKLIAHLFITLIIFSCRNQTPTAAVNTEEKNSVETIAVIPEEIKTDSIVKQTDSGKTRLVILFYSTAEGAEHNLINELEDSLGTYSLRIGKNVDYKKTAWGREGETDICFPLNELTEIEKTAFVSWSREILKKGKWVNIYENYPCPVRHKR